MNNKLDFNFREAIHNELLRYFFRADAVTRIFRGKKGGKVTPWRVKGYPSDGNTGEEVDDDDGEFMVDMGSDDSDDSSGEDLMPAENEDYITIEMLFNDLKPLTWENVAPKDAA